RRPTPTPLIYQPGFRYRLNSSPKTVRAASSGSNLYVESTYDSSHLSNKWGDYRSSNAFDNNRSTDWVEGSAGYRLGDYVGCSWRLYGGYSSRIAAYGIAIRGGMQYKGSESWGRNERPRNITVNVNGYDYSFTMSDTMSEQTFYFNGDVIMPDSSGRVNLRLTINSCYELPGDHYDVAINDIDLICAFLN
ncbi:MAG: hypothetical protein II697_02850, partial [Clostridia bacterium]|nr:hypothetical protein [Clostridia bacterium]